MANTYTQIHIQAVFEVQNRDCIIGKHWKDELYKYITGIVQNHHHKLLAINGMPDHLHIFFGMRPVQSISDLLQQVKGDSSRWINEKKFIRSKFSWQEGYGAFSYGKSQVSQVIQYIQNQEEHHKKKTFIEEYKEFLKAFEIDYDEKVTIQYAFFATQRRKGVHQAMYLIRSSFHVMQSFVSGRLKFSWCIFESLGLCGEIAQFFYTT